MGSLFSTDGTMFDGSSLKANFYEIRNMKIENMESEI
jgi:hypothetical protein